MRCLAPWQVSYLKWSNNPAQPEEYWTWERLMEAAPKANFESENATAFMVGFLCAVQKFKKSIEDIE